jgi:hypothetical protein
MSLPPILADRVGAVRRVLIRLMKRFTAKIAQLIWYGRAHPRVITHYLLLIGLIVKRQVNTKSEHFDRPGSESYMKSGLVVYHS